MPNTVYIITDSEIWGKVTKRDSSILSDPRVSKLKDFDSWTPLHYLADRGVKEVLKHPDASTAKNAYSATPLHLLANRGVKEAWFHPDFDKVKDDYGKTPRNWWLRYYEPLTCMDIIKNYDDNDCE